MKGFRILMVLLCACLLNSGKADAQTVPTVQEVQNFFSNGKILMTYRDGEVIYGTYHFIEIHYCPNGYGMYGNTVKKTVLGNEQRTNWQEFGTWQITEQNGLVGLYYMPVNSKPYFVALYRFPNGMLTMREGVTIVHQGRATCM